MGKILLLGGDADANVGDTAILKSLYQCIARAWPGAQVCVLSNRPGFGELLTGGARGARARLSVLPRGPGGFASLVRAAPAQNLIMVGGGGLFQDDDSRIKMPYWAARIALLRALNARIVGHSLGAGPLEHPESRGCARMACGALRSVSVRDRFAQRWLSGSIGRNVDVVPDPAFMLEPVSEEAARAFVRSLGLAPGRPVIGVALRRWFHRRGGFIPHRVRALAGLDRGEGRAQMATLRADVARALRSLSRRLDASVLLMPSYHAEHEGDARECSQLLSQLQGVDARMASITDPSLYKAVAGLTTVMISARMHPLILAASMGVPIVGLAYNGKFEGLFDLLGRRSGMSWMEYAGCALGGPARDLEALTEAALAEPNRLRERCEELAARTTASTCELVREATA
jgi:polysaccharide pyruvyl transferase WcaK-like protein